MEPDEFIENIPYSETRHYVKKVPRRIPCVYLSPQGERSRRLLVEPLGRNGSIPGRATSRQTHGLIALPERT